MLFIDFPAQAGSFVDLCFLIENIRLSIHGIYNSPMVNVISIIRIVAVTHLHDFDAVDIGHDHGNVHLHIARSKSFVCIYHSVVVIADPFQKLRKAHIFCSVRRNAAIIQICKLPFAVDFLTHQKILFMAHGTALPDGNAVLFHLYRSAQLLQRRVCHIAQRHGKLKRASFTHFAGQRGADELFRVGNVADIVDTDLSFPCVYIRLHTSINFVAHRLAPKYLILMLQSADAAKTRVPTTPSGIVSPSIYCQSVDLARMPTSKPLRDTAMFAAVSLRLK